MSVLNMPAIISMRIIEPYSLYIFDGYEFRKVQKYVGVLEKMEGWQEQDKLYIFLVMILKIDLF